MYEDKIVKFDPTKTHLKPEREIEEPVTNPVYLYGMAILLSIITSFLLYKIFNYIFSSNDNEETAKKWKNNAFERNKEYYKNKVIEKSRQVEFSAR